MRFEKLVMLVVVVLFVGCSKKSKTEVIPEVEHTISGVVSAPDGTPLKGVLVTFDLGAIHKEVTTNDSGQYLFKEKGNRTIDLYFYGKPLRYLDMRDRGIGFGGSDRTFDKTMVPWEIEEVDFLTANFVDNTEKSYSLVQHNFDELNMQPGDFKNLSSTVHLQNYETTFTKAQHAEEMNINVSFYSMPKNSGYSIDNNDSVTYADLLTWQKILTISTTTSPIGVLEPVVVNLASAYANFPDYDHSGAIIMVSEEIDATLGVRSDVDLLEIRLPYGDDFQL